MFRKIRFNPMEFLADLDWARYWFMFPVSICVATTTMLSLVLVSPFRIVRVFIFIFQV